MAWNVKAILAGVLLASAAPLLGQATEDNWEGLVRVKSDKIELVYLAPEADFRPYTQVLLDPSEMAMKKNWLRDQRRDSMSLGGQATERDVTRALTQGQKQFDSYFAEAYTKAGFQLATAPGPDVVRIRSGVVDIDVVAPDVASSARSRTYSEEAGAATLVIEVRDSVTNALLGRAIERRIAGDNGPWIRNSASNRADFDQLFRRWAELSANGLTELKALSPVDVNGARLAR
ncbi:MAG TPA: DUF3313 family protein [Croceibacterium sp.]